MKTGIPLQHRFVESLPDALEEKTVYVCMEFATAAHKCICGCGREVVTPLSPTDWKLIYDGKTVTLYPSIGNWNFPCRSHYWIRGNRVEWAPAWSNEEVSAAKAQDRLAKESYFDMLHEPPGISSTKIPAMTKQDAVPAQLSLWDKIVKWWEA